MLIFSLLGKSLKADEVIEFLEEFDVDVIYDFDRLHENSPDVYWAPVKDAGVQLRFNERQRLDTAFCYLAPRDGFSPIEPEAIGVPLFDSFAVAEQTCQRGGVEHLTSTPPGAWLKVLGSGHHAHYEFKNGSLSMVTLMLAGEENPVSHHVS